MRKCKHGCGLTLNSFELDFFGDHCFFCVPKSWWKVFTDRSPDGTFVQARSAREARHAAERDGRGRAFGAEAAS